MPTIGTEPAGNSTSINISGDELTARLPDLGGHRIYTSQGAYGHIHTLKSGAAMITLDLLGDTSCANCGARVRLNPENTMTIGDVADSTVPLAHRVDSFDHTIRQFTAAPVCPLADPALYDVEIAVPSGKLLVRNMLTIDRSSALHYSVSRGGGAASINNLAGQRLRTQTCAAELNYAIAGTTAGGVDLWRLADGSVQFGGPGHQEGNDYGRYDENDDFVSLDQPGEHLGYIDLGVWSIEAMDLDAFTAAGGRLDDLDEYRDQAIVEVTPGTYRFTVLNEAHEVWRENDGGLAEQPDPTVARLTRIG